MEQETKRIEPIDMPVVIIHKGRVWQGLWFENRLQARNVLKWTFPNTKWKEPQEDILENARFGTKFEIIELLRYNHEHTRTKALRCH